METACKKDAIKNVLHEDNIGGIDGLTADLMAPWDPYFLKLPAQCNLDSKSYANLVIEWVNKKDTLLRTYGKTSIMFPDITPQGVNNRFYKTMNLLLPILQKDSPQRFLKFFQKYGRWLSWRSMITPEAFNCFISFDAVKCAKVVLEGKAPELEGHRANPNWMNQYGYFPLHQVARVFSLDMIKLLISKGASANVRTAGDGVIEGLLPLHVAVENTCLHKYLEDNQLPNRKHPSFSHADVYKLIHVLCLPEMKIFLDVITELAKHTNDLTGEVWNYIKDGKLVQAGVLLLAAQERIRLELLCKEKGNIKADGFSSIINQIANHFYTFDLEMVQKEKEVEQPHANIKYLSSALLLVNAISQAGKTLHQYIRASSEDSHGDVLERVSSILKNFGFYPTPDSINIGNLRPYKCRSYEELLDKYGRMIPTKNATKVHCLHAAGEKAEMKKVLPRKWELGHKKELVFPYWRTVLLSPSPVNLVPSHALAEAFAVSVGQHHSSKSTVDQQHGSKSTVDQHRGSKLTDEESATIPKYNLQLLGKFQQQVNCQPRRSLSTAAMLLKVLRNA